MSHFGLLQRKNLMKRGVLTLCQEDFERFGFLSDAILERGLEG